MGKRFTFLMLLLSSSFANAQQWEWAKNIAYNFPYNPSYSSPKQNNLFAAENGNFYISSNHDSASSIVKFNSLGDEVWRDSLLANNISIGGIAPTNGGVFITGSFSNFLHVGDTIITSAGSYDIFLLKFTSNGDFVWAKTLGGPGADKANGICTDNEGKLYLTGYYNNACVFDTLNLYTACLHKLFIAKYDQAGNRIYLKSGECENSNSESKGLGIVVDNLKNIYVMGEHNYFRLDTFFIGLGGGPYSAFFLCKLDSAFHVEWASAIEGTILKLTDISSDIVNNILLTGHLHWTNGGTTFSQKYSPSGQLLWEKKVNGAACYGSVAQALGVSSKNYDSYIVGKTYWGGYNCTDVFNGLLIVKYNSIGDQLFYDTIKGTADLHDVITDSNGDLIVCGTMGGNLIFGDDTLYSSTPKKVFIAKFHDDITTNIKADTLSNNEIIIYPNPSNGNFTINTEISTPLNGIHVYDVLGNCVWKKECRNIANPVILDLTGQPKGIYFLAIMNNNKRELKKLILN